MRARPYSRSNKTGTSPEASISDKRGAEAAAKIAMRIRERQAARDRVFALLAAHPLLAHPIDEAGIERLVDRELELTRG